MITFGIHLEPHVVVRLDTHFRVIIADVTPSEEAVDGPHVGVMVGANRSLVRQLQSLFGGRGETTVLALYVLLEVASKL